MVSKLKGEDFDAIYDNNGRELSDSKVSEMQSGKKGEKKSFWLVFF